LLKEMGIYYHETSFLFNYKDLYWRCCQSIGKGKIPPWSSYCWRW